MILASSPQRSNKILRSKLTRITSPIADHLPKNTFLKCGGVSFEAGLYFEGGYELLGKNSWEPELGLFLGLLVDPNRARGNERFENSVGS